MESTVLVKAFSILEVLGNNAAKLPLAELCAKVKLPKPTVHRIANHLILMGYVQRVGNGEYQMSDRFRRLAGGTGEQWLIVEASSVMEELHQETGETVNLGVVRGERVAYLRILESRRPLRRMVEQGATDPFYCTALGRAIVSQWPEERWTRLLKNRTFEARTEKTTVDPEALRQHLLQAREAGIAIEVDENDVGVMCVGAPVFDASGVIAAISISAPSARVNRAVGEKFVKSLYRATKELSARLSQKVVSL